MNTKSMNVVLRQKKLWWGAVAALGCFLLTCCLAGAQTSGIMHPIKNPPQYTQGSCPNCGMMLNMWARTRHAFELSEGHFETCSIHCMADMAKKAGEQPQHVKTALYLTPEKLVPAEQATYVVGSSVKGTMTMVSKIAFGSPNEAAQFAAEHGGEVLDFSATYAKAGNELEKSRPNITMKRKKTGKVKEPTEKDHCTVCGMYPARFPQFRSQILVKEGTMHFCSAKCLITYIDNPKEYRNPPPTPLAIWVTVYPDGDIEYAKGLYYVVGSKVMGPMGPEPLPFRLKLEAEKFAADKGGKVMRLHEVKAGMMSHGHHMEHHEMHEHGGHKM